MHTRFRTIGRPWRRASLTFMAIAALAVACSASPTGPSSALSPEPIGGRTFFVSTGGNDNNPGTRAEPWRRVWYAAAQLRPGDTLYVRGGTYTERAIQLTSRATASSPITIAGFEEEEVIIYAFPGFYGDYMIAFLDSAAHFVVERLIFDARAQNGVLGTIVLGDSSQHIRLKQIEVRNSISHGIFGGGTDHEFITLNVHGNGVSPDHPNSNGVYLTTDNSTIVDGQFFDNACYGVRIFDSGLTGTATNNSVTGAKIYGNGYAVGVGGQSRCASSGGGLVLGDDNNRAEGNLIFENLQGITVFGFKPSNGIKIFSNTVRDNRGNGIEIQRGAVNAHVRDNNLFGNNAAIVDAGTGTILSNNGRH